MPDAASVAVERTRDAQHGDFASNIALRLAKAARTQAARAGRGDRRGAAGQSAAGARRGRRRRLHQLSTWPRRAYARELARIHARGRAYGAELRSAPASACWWNSSPPIPPARCTSATAARPPTARPWPTCCGAVGYRVHREYYINDAGRQMDILAVSAWVRYLRGAAARRCRFPQNGYRGDYVHAARRAAAAPRAARRCGVRPPRCCADLPADAPAGDKEAYIDALIARARADRRGRLPPGAGTVARAPCSPTSATTSPSSASSSITGTSERALARQRRDRARARAARSAQGTAVHARTARCGSAPASSATRRIAWWCARTAQKTYFASDIAYHLDKRERGFELLIDVLGADHHGYVARVRAGLIGHGRAGRLPGGAPDAVREPVPRRREDPDGQARGAVRDAAAAARRKSATMPAASSI